MLCFILFYIVSFIDTDANIFEQTNGILANLYFRLPIECNVFRVCITYILYIFVSICYYIVLTVVKE